MKKVLFLFVVTLTLMLVAAPVFAQTTATTAATPITNLYAAGVSYNGSGSPAVAGTGLYAHLVSASSGTYAFTVVDALPISTKPFTVNTNFSVGVAQKVVTIGQVPIYIPTSAGVSYTGTNTGWAWSTGAMAPIRVKSTNWYVAPTVRLSKSSVSNGSGYQPVVGVLVGWGQ